jgi:sortase A
MLYSKVLVARFIIFTLAVASGSAYLADQRREEMPARLIERAWDRRLAGDEGARPWPWLESVPVARLTVPAFNKDFVVMQGASGKVLAFAPGWNEGTSLPGDPGISLISAYSDRHFGFLRNAYPGLEIIVQDQAGREHHYIVQETLIAQDPDIRVPDSAERGTLLLSTSFPFNNWQQGRDMNFVVVAVEKPPVNIADSGEAEKKA